jgi:hypothetical protein
LTEPSPLQEPCRYCTSKVTYLQVHCTVRLTLTGITAMRDKSRVLSVVTGPLTQLCCPLHFAMAKSCLLSSSFINTFINFSTDIVLRRIALSSSLSSASRLSNSVGTRGFRGQLTGDSVSRLHVAERCTFCSGSFHGLRWSARRFAVSVSATQYAPLPGCENSRCCRSRCVSRQVTAWQLL